MHNWQGVSQMVARQFTCGFCGNRAASDRGYFSSTTPQQYIYICPNCTRPTYFGDPGQLPGVAPGNEVGHLPGDASLFTSFREGSRGDRPEVG
jgi:hypothetical protein